MPKLNFFYYPNCGIFKPFTKSKLTMVYSHFENIRQQILDELTKAENEILVAMYWFTNRELFEKLCDKLKDGKEVQLIVHNDFINNRESGLNFQQFIDLGGKLYFSDPDTPMHNKFCVIDHRTLINGSYNWTYYAENKNNENILLINDENETINAFYNQFHHLTSQLKKVEIVEKLTRFEVDEFSPLSARNYLANDIVYEAKATNNPALVEKAFLIAPGNIKIQKAAVSLDLTKKRKLKYSLSASMINDRYLKILDKGTTIPVAMTKVVATTKDNQASCLSSICYGDNEWASENKEIMKITLYGLPKKPPGDAKMKNIFSVDIYGKLSIVKYSLDNGKRATASAWLTNLLEDA